MSQAATEERAHALLGASGAKIWMACTPSARFTEHFEDRGSEAADEGTAAHLMASLMLIEELGGIEGYTALQAGADLEQFKTESPYYDGEMEEAVQAYVSYVLERYNAALARTPDAILLVEQRVDFSEWVPEGFGTADVEIIADGTIEVIDLKYGRGVAVHAEDNPQIRLYGAGALLEHEILYDIETLLLTIYQPRKDNVSTECITVTELQAWLEEEVRPKAQLAWAGEGDYCAGDHCQFCKGRPRCRALADYNLALARYEFRHPNELTPEEIGAVLITGEKLSAWANSVKEYALQAAIDGTPIPGWKVVEGQSKRTYSDPDAVVAALKEAGYDEAILFERSLLKITAMEKAIGKKNLGTIIGDLVIKPAGAPTLAQESDKRPAIGSLESARADFEEALT